MDGKLIAYYSYVSCARYDWCDFVNALPENHHFPKPAYSHSVLATFHGLCVLPNLVWHTSSPPTLLPIHHHQVVPPALITIDIYIYIHETTGYHSKQISQEMENIDTTNSHSDSSNCRKLPYVFFSRPINVDCVKMYQPFMS